MKRIFYLLTLYIPALLMISILTTISIAATVEKNAPPPMHSLMELDLSNEQLALVTKMVDETEINRRRLRREYRQINADLEAAQQADVPDQVAIRELRRLQVVNRDQMRKERDTFHAQVEPVLKEQQRLRWRDIRSKRQEWCQHKWMKCSNCNCGMK